MNILQEIIVAMLKGMCFNLFKNNLTAREEEFIKIYKASPYFENLLIEKMSDGRFVLLWESRSEVTVACHMTDCGFCFSSPGVYNKEKIWMNGPVSAYFSSDSAQNKIIQKEIEEIKLIFLNYSVDADVYFK